MFGPPCKLYCLYAMNNGGLSKFLCMFFIGVMGEYEPKIEVNFPDNVPAAKGSTVTLECFALGK